MPGPTLPPHESRQEARRSCRSARRARGLTLAELLVALAMLAVLAGLALPSLAGLRERQVLQGVAATLEADIHHARSLAVARNQVVRLSFEAGAVGTCYFVHTGDPDDCRCRPDGSAECRDAQALRAVRLAPDQPVALLPNARSLAFDPVRGTVTPTATIRLRAPSGASIHHIVNVTGRVRACSPGGEVAGLRAC